MSTNNPLFTASDLHEIADCIAFKAVEEKRMFYTEKFSSHALNRLDTIAQLDNLRHKVVEQIEALS
jgi:hypothetical protein